MTTYIIVKWDDTQWSARQDASSAKRAIAAAGLDEGTYLAIPARSLKPITVKVEQITKVTIE